MFDRAIIDSSGLKSELSLSSFLELPLHVRVRHILQREVEFYLGETPVDTSAALQSLREWQLTSGGS